MVSPYKELAPMAIISGIMAGVYDSMCQTWEPLSLGSRPKSTSVWITFTIVLEAVYKRYEIWEWD